MYTTMLYETIRTASVIIECSLVYNHARKNIVHRSKIHDLQALLKTNFEHIQKYLVFFLRLPRIFLNLFHAPSNLVH